MQDDFYRALAKGQAFYNLEDKITGNRGEIFFKNGEPLAVNVEWPLVSLSPRDIKNKEEVSRRLSDILQIEESSILEMVSRDEIYLILKRKLSSEEVDKIKELSFEGVYLQKEAGRYYPQGTLASQLVGFLNAEKVGQYGLEEYYDDVLRGERKADGKDLILTVDYSIQFMAEKLLKEAYDNLNIEAGEVVVIDPNTAEIIALANFPGFDPNEYSKVKDIAIFQNSATQKVFEPGSIFKPITMAGAIDVGVISPVTTYQDPGKIQIGKWSIYNYEQRNYPGDITMTEVLEKSINTGAVFAEQKLGNDNFLNYVDAFGIFKPTGIDLKEIYSDNKELKNGYEVNFATASFGQGIQMTSIQLVRALSAIANGGKLIEPRVVAKLKDGENEEELKTKIIKDNVISNKTSSQLTAMLVSVVDQGYGKPARIPGYYIAGKTGTAQIAWSAMGADKTGYSEKTWQSFIGFAPAFNPQFLILVKLTNPAVKTAEFSAVPLFKELAKYIIDYYQIPPDYGLSFKD
ncbi:MAG: penicillin-binding protein 2 [Candidatus Nealsonbacteria bacterium]